MRRRRDGEEPGLARLACDLARPHRRLDQALEPAGPAFGRHLLRSARRPWRHRACATTLWREGFDRAAGAVAFAKLLAETAGATAPALNWFGGFKTVNGRIDCKKSGLFGIVSTARALAIRHHVAERATPARLAGVKALGLGEADLDALMDAQATFLDLILAQQIRDIADGVPPGNTVEVGRLSRRERERLRGAFQAVAHLDTLTRDLLFRD